MRDNWQLFRGALQPDFCDNLVERFKNLQPMEATTFNSSEDHRRTKVRWVHNEYDLQDVLLRLVNIANANSFNVDIQQEMAEMQFGEYTAEEKSKYDWHHDVHWLNPKNHDRKLSVVVQLSHPQDYEGGQFQFSEVEGPDHEDFGQRGSVLVFPSYLTHRVTEMKSGMRHSLVSWVRGPRWR